MYQVKCTSGKEIQVIGSKAGEKGLCRVIDNATYAVLKTGTYDECVAWCEERAIQVDVPSGNRTNR